MSAIPRKPKRWRPEDVAEHFAWCAETLDSLTADIGAVFERAARDIDTGLRGAGDGVSGGKYGDDGANNGGTPRMAISRVDRMDPVALAINAYLNGVPALTQMLVTLSKHAAFLRGLTPEEARELVEQRKPGRGAECANLNCKRWVENTPVDPLRGGRCDACRKYRERHDGEERPAEKIEDRVYKESA